MSPLISTPNWHRKKNMSLEKTELRMKVIDEIGQKVDDMLSTAKTKSLEWQGAVDSLGAAQKNLQSIMPYVDKDLEDGKFDNLEPLQIAQLLKNQVTRCMGALLTMEEHAKTQRAKSQGKEEAHKAVFDFATNMVKSELAKMERMKALLASEDPIIGAAPRRPGEGPGPSLKERRLQEEAQEKKAKEASSEPPSEGVKEEAKEPEKKAKKRTKRTAKKTASTKVRKRSEPKDSR